MEQKLTVKSLVLLDPIIIMTKFYPWIINYAFNKGLDPDNPKYLTKITQTY